MADREEIVEIFSELRNIADNDVHPVVWHVYSKLRDLIDQAEEYVLAMLKEHETSNTGKARIFQCEKCGYGFDDIFLTDEHNYDIEPNYCPNCGRSVKWEC